MSDDSPDSFDTDDDAPNHDLPVCGVPCDDGTPCHRPVSYAWMHCHFHWEADDGETDG